MIPTINTTAKTNNAFANGWKSGTALCVKGRIYLSISSLVKSVEITEVTDEIKIQIATSKHTNL